MCLLVVSAAPMGQAAAPQGDTFVAAVRNQPTTLDPAIGVDNPSEKFLVAVYEPLVRNRFGTVAEQSIEGVLAQSWSVSGDGLVYTLHLRPNVKFHDGTMLDAEAVKLSIERMKAINLGNSFVLTSVKEIRTPDPMTVQIVLSNRFGPFLPALSSVYVVSAKAIKDHEQNGDWARGWFQSHEDGTGPYTLDSWQLNQQMELSAVPDYWRGWAGPHAKQLILRDVAEPATQRLLIESSDVDWADYISIDDALALKSNKALQVQVTHGLQQLYILMNAKKPPLTNVKLRQALVAAFPYEAMLKNVLHGLDEPASGYLMTGFPQHDHGPTGHLDLARARTLLAEAGYPKGGITLDLIYFGPAQFEAEGVQLYQAELQQLGITLKLEGVTSATQTQRITAPDIAQQPHFNVFYFFPAYGSPDAVLYPLFYSKSTYFAHFGYGNPQVDAWLDEARRTLAGPQQTQLYRNIQQQLREDAPAVPVSLYNPINVYSRRIKHVDVQPINGGVIDYYTIQF
jgi:peptide/nickel transport system substrate-binding protein